MLNGNLLRKIFFLSSLLFSVLFCFFILPQSVFADGTIYLPGYPLSPPGWNAPGGWSASSGHGFSAQPSLKCGGSIFLRWQSAETTPYYTPSSTYYRGDYNPVDHTYNCYDAGYVGSSHVTGCFMHNLTTSYNIYQQLDAYNQILVADHYAGTSYTYTPTNPGSGPDPSSDSRVNPFWYNYSHDYFNNIMYYDSTYRYTGDVTNSAADPRNYSGMYNFTIQACNENGCNPDFVPSGSYPGYWRNINSSPTTVSSACTPNPPYKLNADVSVKQCGSIDISWQKIPEFLSGKSSMTVWKIYRANVYSPSGPAKTVCEDGNYSVYDSHHWYSCLKPVDTSIPYGFGREYPTENYDFNNKIGTGEVPGDYTLVDTISSDATSYTDATAYPYPGDLPSGQTFLGYKYKVVAVNSFGESPDNLIGYNAYYGNTGWYQYGWYDVYSSAKDWWPYFYGDNLATPSLPDPHSGTYVYIYTKGLVKSSGSCVPNGPAYLTAQPSRSECGGAIDVSWENTPEFLSGKTPVTEWRVYRAPVYYHYPNSSETTVYGEYSLIVTLPPSSTSTSYFYSDKKTLPYPTDTLQGQPFYGYNYKVVAVNSFGESTETLAATDLPDYYFSRNSWDSSHTYSIDRSSKGYYFYVGNYQVGQDYKVIYSNYNGYPWYTTKGSTNACAPTGVKVATGPLCGQMTVSWDPTPLANYYNVLGKYTSPYYYTTGYYLPATTTSYIDDLKNHSDSTTNPYKASSVSYKVQVNWDATSPAVFGTSTACVLPTPTNVSAAAAWSCGGGINLNWDTVSYTGYYTISRATSTSGVYSIIATTTQPGSYWSPYNDKSVDPNTTYYYKVASHGDAGDSVLSTSTSATSPDACPPHLTAQTSLQCGGKIDLSWDAVPGAAGYRIQRGDSWWGDWFDISNTTATSMTDSGLSNSYYGYQYQMIPYDSDGVDLSPSDSAWASGSGPCPPSCVDQNTLGVDQNKFYYIKPQADTSNNFVLDMQSGDWNNNGTDDYSTIQLWSKTGADNQKWSIVPTGDGNYFNIISKNSSKSLDGSWGMYSNIFQIGSDSTSNTQKWCFTGNANNGYGIVNKSTIQAMDSYSDWYGFYDGNQIYSNDWYGGSGQLWKVEDENPINNISCDSADKGSFDSAPTSGLCSDGSLPTVTTTPTSFEWYCGGNFCSAQKTLVDPCPGQVSCMIDGVQACKAIIAQCPNDDHAIPSCCNTCYVGYSYNGTKCVKNPDIIFRSNPGYIPKNTSCKIEYNINDAASTTCRISGLGVDSVLDLSSGSASSYLQTPQISTTTPYTLHCTRDTPGDPRPEIDKQTMCRVLKVKEF